MNEENSPTNWESDQPSTWQWVLIAGIAILVLCGITTFISFAVQTYNQWSGGRSQVTTQVAVATTAADIERTTIFREASHQPVLIFDPFVDNVNEWLEEDIDDEYTTMTLTINGRYIWDATAKQGFVWRIWPNSEVVSDFYLAVEAQNLSDNLDAQYGLIFRNDGDSYNYLEVRDSQRFRLFSYTDNEWVELIPYTLTDAIHQGETNRLEIVAKGNLIYVAINGQFVGQAEASYLSEGQVGLIIGLVNEGEEATIAFDNFELRPLETSK